MTGAIDLVYRDPETNALVVADHKADLVDGEDEIQARANGYRDPAATYAPAFRDALALALALEEDPRFELWFLHAGRIVTL